MKNLLYILICSDFVLTVLSLAGLLAGGNLSSFVRGMLPGVLAGIGLIALIMAKKEDKD